MEGKIDACLKALKVVLKQVKGVISERAEGVILDRTFHFRRTEGGRRSVLLRFRLKTRRSRKQYLTISAASILPVKTRGRLAVQSHQRQGDSSNRGSSKTGQTPNAEGRRLETHSGEADVFCTSTLHQIGWKNKFQSTRPGVLWRQQRVSSDDRDDLKHPTLLVGRYVQASPRTKRESDESGASFVRQLATESMIAQRRK